jgi:hypothetical protein
MLQSFNELCFTKPIKRISTTIGAKKESEPNSAEMKQTFYSNGNYNYRRIPRFRWRQSFAYQQNLTKFNHRKLK